MKAKPILLSLLLILAAHFCFAQGQQNQKRYNLYAVAFYNLENLFDTIHDTGKNDYQFLPDGSYHWDGAKYTAKLKNMSEALADLGTDMLPKVGAAIIGVSEVENRHVMEDLMKQQPMADRGFDFVHIEGPDRRGVDCALIYNPRLFKVEESKLVNYVFEPQDTGRATRGFLIVKGQLGGEPLSVIVCHWPSRLGGQSASSYLRENAGKQVRRLKDSLLTVCPEGKVIVMGDLNDDPSDKSLIEGLGCKSEIKDVTDDNMYNPWYNMLVKRGIGTLAYKGKWNLFDQIILSPNLLDRKGDKDFTKLTYYKCQVQQRDYLTTQEGKYKGTPKRTTSGGVWLNGYSDHYPVVIYVIKQQPN